MIIKDINEATYLKCCGFEIGTVLGFEHFEIKGDEKKIKEKLVVIDEARMKPSYIISEYKYLAYLAKKNN
jgi:hypothetical protein